MKSRNAGPVLCLALLLFVPPAIAGDSLPNRPGKGLDFIPGDFAEYSNTEYQGEQKAALPSTIMIVLGKRGELEGVQVLSVKDGKVVYKATVFYDMNREKVARGKLLESGRETLTIAGKQYECSWEKRRDQQITATFWRCPELPFEQYAKVVMETDDGRKRVTELILHGPDMDDQPKNQAFLKRIQDLSAQENPAEKTPAQEKSANP